LPGALFVLIGPFTPDTANIARYTARAAEIRSATIAAGGQYIWLDTITGAWETSSGTSGVAGSQWLTGNASVSSASATITAITRTSNVVTATTSTALGASVGNDIIISGAGPFDGLFKVSTNVGNSLVYSDYGANVSETSPSQLANAVAYKVTLGTGGNMAKYTVAYDTTHCSTYGQEHLSSRFYAALSSAIESM
jgi:hypothetical protein